jgi:hypothetical protein
MKANSVFLLGEWIATDDSTGLRSGLGQLAQLRVPLPAVCLRRIQAAQALITDLANDLTEKTDERFETWMKFFIDNCRCDQETAAFEIESIARQLAKDSRIASEFRDKSARLPTGIILIEACLDRFSDFVLAFTLALIAGNAVVLVCQEADAQAVDFLISQIGLVGGGNRVLPVVSAISLNDQTRHLAQKLVKESDLCIMLPVGRKDSEIASLKQFISQGTSVFIEENTLVVGTPPNRPADYEKFLVQVLSLLKVRSDRSIGTVFTSSDQFAEDLYRRLAELNDLSSKPGHTQNFLDIMSRHALHSRLEVLSALGKVNFTSIQSTRASHIVLDIGMGSYQQQESRMLRVVFRPTFDLLVNYLESNTNIFGTVGVFGAEDHAELLQAYFHRGMSRRIVAFDHFREELLTGEAVRNLLKDRMSKWIFYGSYTEDRFVADRGAEVVAQNAIISSDSEDLRFPIHANLNPNKANEPATSLLLAEHSDPTSFLSDGPTIEISDDRISSQGWANATTAAQADMADSPGGPTMAVSEVTLDSLIEDNAEPRSAFELGSEGPLDLKADSAGEAGASSHVFTIDYLDVLHVVRRFGIHELQIGIELAGDGPPILRICVEGIEIDDSILWNLQSALLDEIEEIAEGLRLQTIQDMVLELYNPGELPRDLETGKLLKFTA